MVSDLERKQERTRLLRCNIITQSLYMVYSILQTLDSRHHTSYVIRHTPYAIHHKLYTKHYTTHITLFYLSLNTILYTLYTMHYTLHYIIHRTIQSICFHFTLYNIHPTIQTIHFKLYSILHIIHYTVFTIYTTHQYTLHYRLHYTGCFAKDAPLNFSKCQIVENMAPPNFSNFYNLELCYFSMILQSPPPLKILKITSFFGDNRVSNIFHHSLSDFFGNSKTLCKSKKTPKQTLCSLLTSDMLHIASNCVLKTSCAISDTSVADTRKL